MKSITKHQELAVRCPELVIGTDATEMAPHRKAKWTTDTLNRLRAAVLIGVCSLLFVAGADAANWYVRSGGAGSNTGVDWNNAWALGGITWASVNPGDTIWLAGGNYSDSLHIQKSGSAGNYIYIKRVRGTDATPASAPGWNSGFDAQVVVAPGSTYPCYWDGGNALGSYINIDGRVDSGISFRCANLSGFSYPGAVYFAPTVNGTHHVTLANLEMAGPVPVGASAYSGNAYLCALSFRGGPSGGSGIFVTDITVTGCRLHGAFDLVLLVGVQRAVFDHCKFYDSVFDSGSFGAHPNLVEWAFSGDITFRYSEFWNWYSEGVMMGAFYDPDPNPYGACYMYGNVFRDPNNGLYSARVVEARWKTQTLYFYNNTCVGFTGNPFIFGEASGGVDGHWSASSQARNNIYWMSQLGSPPSDSDYNFSSTAIAGSHSISSGANPFVNLTGKDFHITSATAANMPRNKGVAIASPYNIDPDGNTRGGDGSWDVGAYEYGVLSTNPVIAVAPSTLSFPPVLPGNTATNYLTVQNTGSGTLGGSASIVGTNPSFRIVSGASYSLGAAQSSLVGISYSPNSANDGAVVNFTGGGGASVNVNGQRQVVLSGLSFPAYAGVITAPFTTNGGYVSQTVDVSNDGQAGVTSGGQAVFAFTIPTAGTYTISANVNAPNSASKSFWVNIDAAPTDPTMIWDIFPYTSGFETRTVSWRGSGTPTSDEFAPKTFNLSAGTHQLIVVGREPGVQLGQITITPYDSRPNLPSSPVNLRIVSSQ